MRCYCCNKNLNNYESTLRSATTGEFLDMCVACLKDMDISTLQNKFDPDEQIDVDENEELQ